MRKNNNRRPKTRTFQQGAGVSTMTRERLGETAEQEESERKVGVVSGTPADAFDESKELKRDKWVAIYISVLAVLLAIAATGSNDAMKIAQQAGFGVNDTYSYYQAKSIRQSQVKWSDDFLQLNAAEASASNGAPENVRKLLESKKAEYEKEIARLESDGRNGKKELLAKAENCDNERKIALAQHPFYDYSMAMLQIAIVLASASIITGTRLLLAGSGLVGLFGVLFFLNGFTLVIGAPEAQHKHADELAKTGVQLDAKCIEE
jgi:Domain of unknown function (DUF4337)